MGTGFAGNLSFVGSNRIDFTCNR